MNPEFHPGNNIAMKVPAHEYAATVAFYRDIIGLKEIEVSGSTIADSCKFKFGDKTLWIDSMPGFSQAEIWLELLTEDPEQAADYLQQQQCIRRDEIEPLPTGFKGFWIANPANIIHLVNS